MSVENYLNSAKMAAGLSPNNQYFYSPYFDSIAILLIFFALSKLVVLISTKIILNLTKKTKTDIDDKIIIKTNKPVSLILLLVGIRLALLPLGINQTFTDIIEHAIASFIILIITYIVAVVLDIFVDNWAQRVAQRTHSDLDDEIIPLLKKFTRVFVSIVGLLFVLPVWGIEIGPLLASLGIVGIAVAFALQSTLANIFGGASILLDKSIKVGDKIKLDNDTIGAVVDVGLRSTKIKTFDNELITVPNGKLADSKILNFIQPDPSVRATVDFGVEYGSDASKVREIVLAAIKKLPNIQKEPEPKVLMTEMADSALKFRALFWVREFDAKFEAKALATEEIYNSLRKAGIGIPFPTRTVYLKQ